MAGLGCTGPEPIESGPVPARGFEIALEQLVDGVPVPLDDGGTARMYLGFQGFLMLTLFARGPDAPDIADAAMSAEIEGAAPVSVNQPRVGFTGSGDDRVSGELLFFLSSSYSSWYAGREAEIAVKLAAPDAVALAVAHVTLVEGEDCHDESGCGEPDDSGDGEDSG